MTFYKDGSVRKSLTFNAQKSRFDSWFQRELLTYSSWSDLRSFKEKGIFSLRGPCRPGRGICNNLRVSQGIYQDSHKALCKDDKVGWFYRGTFDDCDWEERVMYHLLYCKGDTACEFDKEGEIFVRIHEICPYLHAIILQILRKLAKKKN